jgi:hypothetical protein
VKTILKSHDLEAKVTQEKNNTIQPKSVTEKMRISASKLNSGLSETKDGETKEKVIAGKKKYQVKRKVPSKFEHNLTAMQRVILAFRLTKSITHLRNRQKRKIKILFYCPKIIELRSKSKKSV